MQASHILGVDVAKDKFDVNLRSASAEEPRPASVFANQAKGFKALDLWLAKHAITHLHVCLEATSRYGEALATHLQQRGHTVSVVNPLRTRRYADSRLVRTQNDQIDAALIADFCAKENPRPWLPLAPAHRQLQDLVRTRDFFRSQKQQCANRLEGADGLSAEHLHRQIRQLQDTLDQLWEQIIELLKNQPALARQVELIDSIPGVGPLTATVALAELPPIERLEHAGQAVALAGLDPRKKTSGTSVDTTPRLSKMGSRRLRQTLYMAALTALRCNPSIRNLGQRLKAKGKRGKCVMAAAMRKLVRLVYGVLKQKQPFDPNWQNRDRAVGSGGRASGGDELASTQLASPPVATA